MDTEMAKAAAPTSLTGGQGFNFEDHVAARFMVGLLGGIHPFDAALGRPVRVDWQARDAGWLLDDLLVTCGSGERERAVAISAKNYRQVTQSGFPDHFVRACWEQWLGVGTHRQFRAERDVLCLITGELADGVREAWDDLLSQAIETASTPERLVARMQPPGQGQAAQSSELQRSLFSSLHCPADLLHGDRTNHDATATLLRHIRLIRIDAESTPSASEAAGVESCQSLLARPSPAGARALWDTLCGIAARKRGRGGSIDLPELLKRLAGRVELIDHPDYRGDWAELDRRSRERYGSVGQKIGGVVRWWRSRLRERLRKRLRSGVCAVVGPSGVGKSALLRALGDADGYRVVWLAADLFTSGRETGFETALGVRHRFDEVLGASPRRCLVVFDGVEGFSEAGLHLAARLVGALRTDKARVHVAISVQTDGLNRIRSAFVAAGCPPVGWQFLTVRPPAERVIERLLERFTALAGAAQRPEFRSLLGNLKVFDWVVRLAVDGGLGEPEGLVTLTAVIDRLWAHFVEGDADGLARSEFLKRLAATEADDLSVGTPLSALHAGELGLLRRLESFSLVRRQDERVRFTHDLLADWARSKLLVEGRLPDSATTVRRAAGVGWFRAVRLYAQRLLEQSAGGVDHWRRCLTCLGSGEPERLVVRDLFLDALVVTGGAGRLLAAAWPVLVADDGRLLGVLLERFAYVGTVPDSDVLGRLPAAEAAELEHLARTPYVPYWAELLPVLSRCQDELVRLAPGPTAKLLRLWLSRILPRRRDTLPLWGLAADLAIAVAREVQACCGERGRRLAERVKADAYTALLWAAAARPDSVAEVCLELACRRPEHESVQWRRAAAEADSRADRAECEPIRPPVEPLPDSGHWVEDETSPTQWPDGPTGRVDDGFRKACLDCRAILPLVIHRPEAAMETLLAVLIELPVKCYWSDLDRMWDQFGLADGHTGLPPMYDDGPFLALYRSGEETSEFGLRLLCRVVNFATDRWREHHSRLLAKYDRDVIGGPSSMTIVTAGGPVECHGDRQVLRWHEGVRTQPKTLYSLLMATEKWLYDEVEGGRPITRWVDVLLRDGRSAAIVGVLVQVARYRPELLAGPLLPLVGVWELHSQVVRLEVEHSALNLWSMGWMRYGEWAWNRARDWHCMPHRKLPFVNLVCTLALNVEPVRAAIRQAYEGWELRLQQDPENTDLQGVINQFKVLVRFWEASAKGESEWHDFEAWIRAQQVEASAVQQRENAQLQPLVFPTQCRMRIDKNEPLAAEQRTGFWESLLALAARLETPADEDEAARVTDSVYGGIAVLVLLHPEWLRAEPAREAWCRERLTITLNRPPPRHWFDVAESAGDWNWDTFAGECGVALLAENRTDPLARHLVVRGLVCYRLATVAAVVRRGYRLRDRLGDEFARMVAFATDWAMRRWKLELADRWRGDTYRLWRRECAPRLEGYVRRARVQAISAGESDAAGRVEIAALHRQWVSRLQRERDGFWKWQLRRTGIFWMADRIRSLFVAKPNEKEAPESWWEDADSDDDRPSIIDGVPTTWPGVDTGYLRHAFAWLELAVAEPHVPNQAFEALSELLTVMLRTVPLPAKERHRESLRFPTEFDEWLLERLAGAVVKLDRVNRADALWRPILVLGSRGRYWLKYFLSDFFRFGSQQPDVRPDDFVALWGRMIEFVLGNETTLTRSRSAWPRDDDVVSELLGFEMGEATLGDKPQFARPIGQLAPVFARAAARWFGIARVARSFCRFVQRPAGADLLVPGIRWLADAAPRWRRHDWDEDGFADAIVNVLRQALDAHGHRVIEDDMLREAFQGLCGRLVAIGQHAALALRERL